MYDNTCIKSDVCSMAVCDGAECRHRATTLESVDNAGGFMNAEQYLNEALGGNMNIGTLKPLAWHEIMDGYARHKLAEPSHNSDYVVMLQDLKMFIHGRLQVHPELQCELGFIWERLNTLCKR